MKMMRMIIFRALKVYAANENSMIFDLQIKDVEEGQNKNPTTQHYIEDRIFQTG